MTCFHFILQWKWLEKRSRDIWSFLISAMWEWIGGLWGYCSEWPLIYKCLASCQWFGLWCQISNLWWRFGLWCRLYTLLSRLERRCLRIGDCISIQVRLLLSVGHKVIPEGSFSWRSILVLRILWRLRCGRNCFMLLIHVIWTRLVYWCCLS